METIYQKLVNKIKNGEEIRILMVVDYQKDFVLAKGKLPINNADNISNNIQELINNPVYDYIIYTFDTHNEIDYPKSEESKSYPIHCIFGTEGWDLYNIKPRNEQEYQSQIKKMKVESDFQINEEFFFVKDKFSIWEGNSSYQNFFITNFPKNIIIDVCGVAEDVCVAANVKGLLNNGYNVNVIENAVKAINVPETMVNVEEIKKMGVNYI